MLDKFKKYKLKDYNFFLIIVVIAISIMGVRIVESAGGSYYGERQMMGLAIGLVAMVFVSFIDYNFILKFYWILYILNIVLMLAVKYMGDDAGGAQRWLIIGGIRFQPSELTKILVVLFFARFIYKRREEFNSPKNLIPTLLLMIIPIYLIEQQPDLSTSIVVLVICAVILFVSGLSWKIVLPILAVAAAGAGTLIYIVTTQGASFLKGYQSERILAWLYPDEYPDLSYQQQNSIMAIGSGTLWGKGLDNSAVDSVKNGNYISAPQTDFIFAVTGEELGFFGCFIIIMLLLLITIICFWVGAHAKDLMGKIIAVGIGTWIGFQSFVNICVVTGLMPNTGLTLPFISYGLTSLVSLYMAIGLVLNVGLQRSVR